MLFHVRCQQGLHHSEISMTFRQRSQVAWSFPFLVLASACGATPECDSFETRSAVLQTVSDDQNNALANFAAKNSSQAKPESNDAESEGEKSTNLENSKQKPLYQLGQNIVTTSTSKDKRTLTCSTSISVTIGDTKASKEVNFTVQKSSDGKISVSVTPFQFQSP
jgi:hypothetical protein